jgi:hypothetical protein
MSIRPSKPSARSLWSIQMWCENICTLIESSVAPRKTRFRMMMLWIAFAGGEVTESSGGGPMLNPPPVTPELAPSPMIVLSDVMLCIPAGSAIMPFTWMITGPDREIAASRSVALLTVTVGPPQPPVVPFWPSALTPAKPITRGGLVQFTGGWLDVELELVGGSVGGETLLSTTTSSKDALAYCVARPARPPLNVVSVALATCVPLAKARSDVPLTSRRNVDQLPVGTDADPVASVVCAPLNRRPRSSRLPPTTAR